MKKAILTATAFLLIASSVLATGDPVAKPTKKTKTTKTEKCVKGSKECMKKGC
jgi:hypothetical protein